MTRNTKKVFTFIGLTFAGSYLLVILYFAAGGKWVMPGTMIVSIVYMFIPMVMAILVQQAIYKEALIVPLGVSFKLNRWFLVAWLLPLLIALATLGVSLLLPGVQFTTAVPEILERFQNNLTPEQRQQMLEQAAALPLHPFWLALLQGLIAGPTINAVAGFGEELGWRGLLQGTLGTLGFWKSSLIVGLVWGLWHAPLILQGHNYPQHPALGVVLMTIFTLLFSPIFSYVRIKAGSVIAAAVLHGSLNATAGLALVVVKGGSDLTVGVTGLAGFVVLVLVNLGLWIYDRKLVAEPIMTDSMGFSLE